MGQTAATFESFFFDYPDGVILSDRDGTILEINKAATILLEYSRDELIGQKDVQIIDFARIDPTIVEMMTRSVFSGETYTADLFAKKRDGSSIPIQLLMNSISYQGQQVLAYTIQDITMRFEVDIAMRESEERYRSLVELSPFAIFIVSGEKIAYLNPAAVDLLRAENQFDIIGQHMASFVLPEEHLNLVRHLQDREQKGQRDLQHTHFLDVNKNLVDVEAIFLPIVFKAVPSTQIIGLDITERRLLEEELRQSQKLEAIGLLAGGIAHDFNNILTGIIGYAGLGLGVLDNDHRAYNFFQHIEIKSQEAAKLVHQLLAFSRKDILSFTKLDLNDIIVSSADFLGRVLPEDMDYNTSPCEVECTINADPVALQQILTNLCVNARDAMPEGGSVLISTDIVQLEENNINSSFNFTPGYFVKLIVKDMGLGMNEETLKQMYDPFFTTKGIGEGSGLGLSMVYGLVKQHNGLIHCKSKVGEGTSFEIYFPYLASQQAISSIAKQDQITIRGRETILLVEDDIDVITILQGILESSGYTVRMAKNGKVAADIILENNYVIDLVITDLVMPEMSGTELYKRVENLPYCPEFLYISGYARDSEIKGLKLSPDIEFMKKPFTATELNRRVRKVIDKTKD
ncbi:MAG: PAS domain S-box protein [Candidatus Marinimicrobia bacterium]|nr:PAS domain S-box protein [Candidatus Neomarinimicrobiota bacterium]